MAAPVFESFTSSSSANDRVTVTVNKPTGTVEGDLLIAYFWHRDIEQVPTAVTWPSGWTELLSEGFSQSFDFPGVNIGYKVAGGSEPTTYDFTTANAGSDKACVIVARISGADPVTPFPDTPTTAQYTSSTNSPDCPSITTSVNDSLVFNALCLGTAASTDYFTPPSGVTEIAEARGGSLNTHATIVLGYFEQASAGATGAKTWSSANDIHQTATFAVAPYPFPKIQAVAELTGNVSGSSITIDKPTGTVEGDVLVAVLGLGGSFLPSTGPSGWTQELGTTSTNGQVWIKVAGASEPTTYTWTGNSTGRTCGHIIRISDADTSTPVNVSAESNEPSGTTHDCPAVTTTVANCLILRSISHDQGQDPFTVPAGTTFVEDSQSGSGTTGQYVISAEALKATAGSTGTATYSIDAADTATTYTIAIQPPQGGGGGTTVDLSTVPAIASESAVDPTVTLGSLSITPAAAILADSAVDPTVSAGALSVSPAAAIALDTAADPSVLIASGPVQVDLTNVPATALDSAVDPGVTLGSLTVSPASAIALDSSVDPTVVLGSPSVTPTSAIALDAAVDPTVVLGNLSVTPTSAIALDAAVDPTVALGNLSVTPASAIALDSAVDPTVALGNLSVTPGSAIALDSAASPNVSAGGNLSIIPDVAAALDAAVDPTVTLGAMSVTPASAISLDSAVDPSAVSGGLSIEPSAAITYTSLGVEVGCTGGGATQIPSAHDETRNQGFGTTLSADLGDINTNKQIGDVVYVQVAYETGFTGLTYAGNFIQMFSYANSDIEIRGYYLVITASNVGSTLSWSSSASGLAYWQVDAVIFRGLDLTQSPIVNGANDASANSAITCPALIPAVTRENTLVARSYVKQYEPIAGVIPSAPASHTQLTNGADSSNEMASGLAWTTNGQWDANSTATWFGGGSDTPGVTYGIGVTWAWESLPECEPDPIDLTFVPAIVEVTAIDPTVSIDAGGISIDLSALPAIVEVTAIDPEITLGSVTVDLTNLPAVVDVTALTPDVIIVGDSFTIPKLIEVWVSWEQISGVFGDDDHIGGVFGQDLR